MESESCRESAQWKLASQVLLSPPPVDSSLVCGLLSRGVASELSLSLEVPGVPEDGGEESYREQKY